MLQSFIVYTLFALALFACSRVVTGQIAQTITRDKWYSLPSNYWWCVFIFALVAGFRYDVGIDYLSYLDSYMNALNGTFYERGRGIEEAYKFVTIYFGKLGIHPIVYMGFLASIQIYFILLTYRKERSIVPWMLMFIVLGGPFFTWMNGIRQMIAACIFVFSTQYIRQKKLISFMVCIATAYLWHHSALILAPTFLLIFDKTIWTKHKFIIPIFIVCFVLGSAPTWISSISNLGDLLQFLGYDMYADRVETLTDVREFRSFSFGPRMICMLGTYILILVLYPKVSEYFKSDILDITFKFFFIGICSYYLFVNTSMYFLRPVLYFTIFAAPMVGYTLAYLYNKKKTFLFVLFIVMSMSYTYLSCLSDASQSPIDRNSYLYEFYFDNM